jgi:hypothetical protein
MNRFAEEVNALLAQTPPRPELNDLKSRARRHRVRQSAAFAVIAVAMAVATVGIAGGLGHRSSSPEIAVSPSTSTTSPAAAAAACQLRFLDEQETQLKQLEKQLNNQLTVELLSHSPNAGATDAAHQAVLRELSDVAYRILKVKSEQHARLDLDTSTPVPDDAACGRLVTNPNALSLPTLRKDYRLLDARRAQLGRLETTLNQQLTDALARHASNAGVLDARHQAVLREQADVEQRILRLEESRASPSDLPRPENTTSTEPSTR